MTFIRLFFFNITAALGVTMPHAMHAATPQQSAIEPAIVILCPDALPGAVCRGMFDQLSTVTQGRPIGIQKAAPVDGQSETVRFLPTQQGAHILAGHIEWRKQTGVTIGPRVDLTVVDSILTEEMLHEFGLQLIATFPHISFH